MHRLFAALMALSMPLLAQALEELVLQAEHPVDGIPGGNLSGLAWCGEALWTVSDREDDRLYRLESGEGAWQAQAELFSAPVAPPSGLPWGLRISNGINGVLRGGQLDFEGLSCDAAGNRYLVSETQAGVLQLPPAGSPRWLELPANLTRQARARGLLLRFNAAYEGLTVDPAGQRLWLAAERQSRGLLALQAQANAWACNGNCVLLRESGDLAAPEVIGGELAARDFSGLAFYDEKLFTLERLAHRVCRRNLDDGAVERCWSFAAEALTDERRYNRAYGMAEALWLDEQGAWIGLDNGFHPRGDDDARPIIWRFAAPAGGWSAAR
ncbi:MAG: esterase-like activity of phytase family protein [Pseudomonadota bacterium]